MKTLKNAKGITLIALVVTIVILMILAGIVVASAISNGDSRLIIRTREAKETNRGGAVQDEVTLALAENKITDEINKTKGLTGGLKTKADVVADLVAKGYLINDEPDKLLGKNGKEEQDTITIGSITIDFSKLAGETTGDTPTTPADPTTTSNSSKKLTEIVKKADYGKSIDYSVTVNGTTLNNWKVFLNDGNNVYIILENNLIGNLMPDLGNYIEKCDTAYNYTIYQLPYYDEGEGETEDIANGIIETELFQDFATGNGALSATGGPTLEQFEASYGQSINEGDILEGSLYTTRRLAARNHCIRLV